MLFCTSPVPLCRLSVVTNWQRCTAEALELLYLSGHLCILLVYRFSMWILNYFFKVIHQLIRLFLKKLTGWTSYSIRVAHIYICLKRWWLYFHWAQTQISYRPWDLWKCEYNGPNSCEVIGPWRLWITGCVWCRLFLKSLVNCVQYVIISALMVNLVFKLTKELFIFDLNHIF